MIKRPFNNLILILSRYYAKVKKPVDLNIVSRNKLASPDCKLSAKCLPEYI
jgi:hypothetical protein